MIINFENLGGGGGGGSYVLPTATASRLGGVKIGSGITVDSGGTISVTGGTSVDQEVVYFRMSDYSGTTPSFKDLYDEALSAYTEGKTVAFITFEVPEASMEAIVMYLVNVSNNDAIYMSAAVADQNGSEIRLYRSYIWPDGSASNIEANGGVRRTKTINGSIPTASASQLGGVKIGSGITVDSGGTISVSGSSESNIALFNLLTEYGTSNSELARLFADMEAASGAGKTIILVSAMATDDLNDRVLAECEKDTVTGNYYAKTGVVYSTSGATMVARIAATFREDTTYNVTKKNGHFYFNALGSFAQYTLPMAAANTLGGIKVGSGLSIDNNGVLSVSGGSDGGDYKVVSGLPASAENGQLFFVPAHSANTPYYTYTFDCSGMKSNGVEDYVIKDGEGGGGNINGKGLYFSPNDGEYGWFHWDWGENEDDWTHINNWGYYKVDKENNVFYAAVPEEQTFAELNEYVSMTTGTTAFTEDFFDETYRYSKGAEEYFYEVRDRIEINSDGAFDIFSSTSADLGKLNITYNGVPVTSQEGGDYNYNFHTDIPKVSAPLGTSMIYKGFNIGMDDGNIEESATGFIPMPITVHFNMNDSGFTANDEMLGRVVMDMFDGAWYGGNHIAVVIHDEGVVKAYTTNTWFRQLWDANNSDWFEINDDNAGGKKIFGCEFYMGGDKIVAEWVVSDDGATLLNWVVTQNAHSASDSTDPNA